MPKPIKFNYEKKEPFRDASLFVIICEGENREVDYFRFFDGLSSRVTVIPVKSDNGSAPTRLVTSALEIEIRKEVNPEQDRLWFVIDTDRWREQLHHIRTDCRNRPHWQVAQSNPCFEVWLYFHVKGVLPAINGIEFCNQWKPFVSNLIKGGFNSDYHPIAIETATINAQAAYQGDGYLPLPGSTQVWSLAAELLPLIKKELDNLKHSFPAPQAKDACAK